MHLAMIEFRFTAHPRDRILQVAAAIHYRARDREALA